MKAAMHTYYQSMCLGDETCPLTVLYDRAGSTLYLIKQIHTLFLETMQKYIKFRLEEDNVFRLLWEQFQIGLSSHQTSNTLSATNDFVAAAKEQGAATVDSGEDGLILHEHPVTGTIMRFHTETQQYFTPLLCIVNNQWSWDCKHMIAYDAESAVHDDDYLQRVQHALLSLYQGDTHNQQ